MICMLKKKYLLTFCLFLFIVCFMQTTQAWYNTDWNYRKEITIDHDQVPGDITNIPILINLTDTDLRDMAQNDGDDILFTDSNDNKLDHEIETYTSGTGRLIAWVEASLDGDTNTTLYMYFNNSGCGNQQNVNGTWGNSFVAVYHMTNLLDSTQNDNDLSMTGAVGDNANSRIGNGKVFDNGDYFTLKNYSNPSTMTFTCWGYGAADLDTDDTGRNQRTLFGHDSEIHLVYDLGSDQVNGFPNNGVTLSVAATANKIEGNWSYYCLKGRSGSTSRLRVYLSDGTVLSDSSAGGVGYDHDDLWIGEREDATNRPWRGTIDEFRISSAERNYDWLTAEYNNIMNATDGGFYTLSSRHNPPVLLVNTTPVDGTQGVALTTTGVYANLEDQNGDTFNWSIETSPDIGNSSANGENNGTKHCPVSGLQSGTTYTVYVNATDGYSSLNETFTFSTFGSVEFWCFDETDPTVGIPFGVEISNSHYYVNYSLTNGDNISISDLPFGDNVVFFVNSSGYESRIYTYTISAVSDYNFTFYLPPEMDNDVLRYRSTTVTDPTSDVTITLSCEPRWIVTVQGWNESLYGHWFTIPEANYTLSGSTITVNQSMLDDNTSIVQAQYYCDDDVLDYIIHIEDAIGKTLNQAKIEYNRIYDENLTLVGSTLTDGNGDATLTLIPGVNYLINLSKSGYINQTANFMPTEAVRTKTYILEYQEPEEEIYGFYDLIVFNATMYSNSTIKIVYVDLDENTTSAVFTTYETYNDSKTLIGTNNTNSNSAVFWVTIGNTSRQHIITLNLTHSRLGSVTKSVIVSPIRTSIADIDVINTIITNIIGDFDLGYVQLLFMFLPFIGILGLAAAGDKRHVGGGLIASSLYLGWSSSVIFGTNLVYVPVLIAIGFILTIVKGGIVDL